MTDVLDDAGGDVDHVFEVARLERGSVVITIAFAKKLLTFPFAVRWMKHLTPSLHHVEVGMSQQANKEVSGWCLSLWAKYSSTTDKSHNMIIKIIDSFLASCLKW